MLALLVGAVTWLYETTAWAALFCCTAGCAMQNFASGLTELCWALAGVPETADASLGAHLTRFGINVTCILAVYVPFYLAFVRKISRANIEAINIKCHDIKHQIRALAGGGANHGFGLRSMRLTVESYSGTLTTLVDYQRRTLHVNVMIPLP